MNDLPQHMTRVGRSRASRSRKTRQRVWSLAALYSVTAIVTSQYLSAKEEVQSQAEPERQALAVAIDPDDITYSNRRGAPCPLVRIGP